MKQKPINNALIEPNNLHKKLFMNNIIFVLSAAIIAGVLFGLKDRNWLTVTGFLMALFWMLITMGYRGVCLSYAEYIIRLEKHIMENDASTIEQ